MPLTKVHWYVTGGSWNYNQQLLACRITIVSIVSELPQSLEKHCTPFLPLVVLKHLRCVNTFIYSQCGLRGNFCYFCHLFLVYVNVKQILPWQKIIFTFRVAWKIYPKEFKGSNSISSPVSCCGLSPLCSCSSGHSLMYCAPSPG